MADAAQPATYSMFHKRLVYNPRGIMITHQPPQARQVKWANEGRQDGYRRRQIYKKTVVSTLTATRPSRTSLNRYPAQTAPCSRQRRSSSGQLHLDDRPERVGLPANQRPRKLLLRH